MPAYLYTANAWEGKFVTFTTKEAIGWLEGLLNSFDLRNTLPIDAYGRDMFFAHVDAVLFRLREGADASVRFAIAEDIEALTLVRRMGPPVTYSGRFYCFLSTLLRHIED